MTPIQPKAIFCTKVLQMLCAVLFKNAQPNIMVDWNNIWQRYRAMYILINLGGSLKTGTRAKFRTWKISVARFGNALNDICHRKFAVREAFRGSQKILEVYIIMKNILKLTVVEGIALICFGFVYFVLDNRTTSLFILIILTAISLLINLIQLVRTKK